MNKKQNTHIIATVAILVALMIVLSQVLGFENQMIKITFSFVPEIVMAYLFGPFWTATGAVVADIIGNTLLAKSPFFIGFTINALLGGLIYGFYFYQKPITLKRAFLCVLTTTLLITLGLTPLWLAYMYKMPLTSSALWTVRLTKAAIMLPVRTFLIYFFGRAIPMDQLGKKFLK